jgi:hypothetical protein
MNTPKCNENDYINFLMATQKVFSCTETGKVQSDATNAPCQLADYSRRIEEYHRGLKQFCGAERSQLRLADVQRTHIGLSVQAFPRFEVFSLKTGYSRFEAKTRIIRDAVKKLSCKSGLCFISNCVSHSIL